MSYQYVITTSRKPRLAGVAERLRARGFLAIVSRDDALVLARPETSQQQLERWGGDVEVGVNENGVLLTVNVGDHDGVLRDVLDELVSQGISTTVDEP